MTGTAAWHINSDEPDLIDYDMSFKQPAQDVLYAPDPFRSSDHDPVIVGLQLTGAPIITPTPTSTSTPTSTPTATPTSTATPTATSTPTSTPLPSADLRVRKDDDLDPARVSQPLTYTLSVRNNGPGAAVDVVIVDRLPNRVRFVSAEAEAGTCQEDGGVVTCRVDRLGHDETVRIRIVVTPTRRGILLNLVAVGARNRDPVAVNNAAAELTLVRPAANFDAKTNRDVDSPSDREDERDWR